MHDMWHEIFLLIQDPVKGNTWAIYLPSALKKQAFISEGVSGELSF